MIYVIIGPTGSGKSEVAHELSDYFNAPIINADAFQIYKDMNIGTAKISKDDLHYKRYHLLDILTPDYSYSVKQYQSDFRQIINSLLKDNKNIVVVGGTGLYIKASLYDYIFQDEEPFDDTVFEGVSNEDLYKELCLIDLKSAAKTHPNNRKRVIRALIIAKQHVISKSENIANQSHDILYKDVRFLYLDIPREQLYLKINKRVDEMIKNGLVDEVKNLIGKYKLSLTSSQAIGYKEIISFLSNEISFESAIEMIKQRSRNYAKRQVTFFKHQFEYESFVNKESLLKAVIKHD